ncbi:Por secretion system C-terminal sorting domain-containing protein [Marivirga sericea]|uniref:Por secretion system C-terminal sorting domain-containing protein n=1 Tax=Marivirga sericea TaxID=1028 RepID=A0A1X7JIU9_9BACT|nr:N-acetylmuramoyl-L-alanine amidase [Marivirga sericea]SMG27673.1 Por secretion system C-terminal sorting domain-containing protein [Marivirga sericea]
MRTVFTLLIFIFCNQLHGQVENIHASFVLNSGANERFTQSVDFSFTAIALKSKETSDFSEIGFIHESDTIYFNNDLHSDNSDQYFYSSLIHFDQAIKSVDLYGVKDNEKLEVVLINGSGQYSDYSLQKGKVEQNNDCELTGVIQQSEWRAGLPEPSYTRSFTTTENMIVHHSAGSNNISDYTQAVRSIYIFHTEENGWSDIGYNYLVAPNGVIYAGRDPAAGDQDKVLGAHFCGSNSSTMGICLMGNYETVEPPSEMLESLEQVLSWKAFKDDLAPLDVSAHPLNSNLGVIAGHQEGCSTLCPGENVYKRLQQIRVNVEAQLEECSGEDEEEPIVVIEIDSVLSEKIYPNPIKSDFSFSMDISEGSKDDLRFIYIFNQEGKRIKWQNIYFTENKLEVKLPSTLKPGIYFLQTSFRNGDESSQRFVIQ